jgi:hypothetical protein
MTFIFRNKPSATVLGLIYTVFSIPLVVSYGLKLTVNIVCIGLVTGLPSVSHQDDHCQ